MLRSNFGYFYYGNLYNTFEWIECCSSRVRTEAGLVKHNFQQHGQWEWLHPQQVYWCHRAVWCGQHAREKGSHPEGSWKNQMHWIKVVKHWQKYRSERLLVKEGREPWNLWGNTTLIYMSKSWPMNLKSKQTHLCLGKRKMCVLKLRSVAISLKDSCVVHF